MISQWIHSHIKKNNGVTLDKLRSSDKMPGKRVEQPTSDIKKLQGKEGEILNGIGDAIVILDNELNIIWTNEFALKKWNAVPGKKCYQAIRSREDPCAICNARRTLTDGKVRSSEEDIVAKDGAYINFMITCSLIRDSIGERDWIAIVYHDTTNRKKAETRLKDSEEKYRNLVERANDGITIIQDGLVKYANPRHSEIMGYTIEELINTPFTDYIHPDKRPIVADLYKRRMAGEDVPKVYETVVKHKDGTDVDVEFNAGIITYQGEKADFVIVRDITERKLADNILKFRNIILSTQQETSLDGILVVDENRRIISFNQRFIDIWDIPAEVIESNSDERALQAVLDKLVDPAEFLDHVEYLYSHRKKKSREEVALKDGRILDRYSSPMIGSDKKYYGRVWYFRDITERKHADEEIRTAHQQLFDIIEFLPDATFVFDADKKVIAWNRAIEEMTGVTKEDILGKGDYTYAVPFYGERRPILIDLVLDFDSDYEEKYHFVEKRGNALLAEAFTPSVYGGKGAYLWAIASPIFDSSGKQSGAIESIHDITKRKRVEEDLREQKEFAASLVRHSTVPTFVIDSQHRILHWNHAIEELTGITASEIIGTDRFYRSKNPSLADVVVSRELGEHFEQSKKYGRSKYVSNGLHAENWVSNLGGMRRYVLFDASPIYNSKGELVGALETLQGITQQKEAEEAIHKYAEKLEYSNELKDLFTDILHHDLLNPAGVIRGHTEVLLEMEENEQKRQSLVAIERNTEKLVNIIQRASKFAKLESMEKLEFQEMDIGAILEGVIENFSRRIEDKKMTLEFEANGEYPARVNPVIEDVFANLLFNAIKYSPKESRIIIDIVDDGEDWRVAITDFGDGISDDDKSRLFERFRRADKSGAKGAGLGLAIVKRLINLHGGSVGVDDNPKGKGSVFWVTVRKAR